MRSSKEDIRRNVVPNWRDYTQTSKLGEFGSDLTSPHQVELFPIDNYVSSWLSNKSIPFAGDLISAAILNGQSNNPNAVDAARFVLSHQDEATNALIGAAKSIVANPQEVTSVEKQTVTDKLQGILSQKESLQNNIRLLKQSREYCCYNPIAYCELARCYVNLGQDEKAEDMMDIAIHLAPEHRYICRSAARLYLHIGKPDKARYVIANNPWIKSDPWLMASEIAINNLMGRSSRFIKKGVELINSQNYSPFSISELSSEIGSIEMENGNKKQCRALFKTALIRPNDNSLAQAKWLQSEYRDLSFQFDDYSYLNSAFEADAMSAYLIDDYNSALTVAIDWIDDMPFTRRPIQFAADMAYIFLKDYRTAIEVLKIGLKANPTDARLLNNLAYAYALNGDTVEAERLLSEVKHWPASAIDADVKVCLIATAGLNEYRKQNFEKGRQLYQLAMTIAEDKFADKKLLQNAILNYAREEVRANDCFDRGIIELVERIPSDTKEKSQLKKDFFDELNKLEDTRFDSHRR